MAPRRECRLGEPPVRCGRGHEHDHVGGTEGECPLEGAEGRDAERLSRPGARGLRSIDDPGKGEAPGPARPLPPSSDPTARLPPARREGPSRAEIRYDGEVRMVAPRKECQVDPLDLAVEPGDGGPEEDGRNPGRPRGAPSRPRREHRQPRACGCRESDRTGDLGALVVEGLAGEFDPNGAVRSPSSASSSRSTCYDCLTGNRPPLTPQSTPEPDSSNTPGLPR